REVVDGGIELRVALAEDQTVAGGDVHLAAPSGAVGSAPSVSLRPPTPFRLSSGLRHARTPQLASPTPRPPGLPRPPRGSPPTSPAGPRRRPHRPGRACPGWPTARCSRPA